MFDYIYKKNNWIKFNTKNLSLLNKQSVTITGLPFSGITSYHRYILSKLMKKKEKPIIIDISFLDKVDILKKIIFQLESEINSIKQVDDIRETIKTELDSGKEFIFCIDRIQNIRNSKENQQFLQSIRALNPVRVKFFSTCNLSVLTNPKDYLLLGSVISENIIPTKVNNLEDTISLIKSFSSQYQWKIHNKYFKKIHQLTGGLVGLVKSVCNYIDDEKSLERNLNTIRKYPNIDFKISEIKQVLKSNELTKDNKLDFNKLDILRELGLINHRKQYRIKLLDFSKSSGPIDRDILQKKLTLQENQLFSHFKNNQNEITSPEDIGEILWKDKANDKYSLWAIYKVIANLRKKLKPFNYKIENHHGRGYSLVQDE